MVWSSRRSIRLSPHASLSSKQYLSYLKKKSSDVFERNIDVIY